MENSELNKIKKVGELFITPKTLSVRFPKPCIIEDKKDLTFDNILEEFPILLKKMSGIKYAVYAESRNDYDRVINKVKFSQHYYEKKDKVKYENN
jgi:hypothetical protein